MISVISLSDDRLSHYSAVDLCPRVVTGLNRVNIFVGKNNCGKSRLLAGLFGGKRSAPYPPLASASFAFRFARAIAAGVSAS